MPRDARACLADIIESCEAIEAALTGIGPDAYEESRLVRSAVEREFTIIGEAMLVLSHLAPDVFASIPQSRRIINFRHQLTHEYPNVNNTLVWGIADRDAPILRRECATLLQSLNEDAAPHG